MKTLLRLSKARVMAGLSVAATAMLLLAPAAQARTAPWSVVPSPNATIGNNGLRAVSSLSTSDVWAVGSAEDANGNNQALVEHWDGTTWTVVSSPNELEGNLVAVAAISHSNVWAVGSFLNNRSMQQALIEHWNGQKWSRVMSPATGPGTVLGAVTIVSSGDVWAVGDFLSGGTTAQTLTEHWDGHTWAVVPSPDAGAGNNLLTGVAAVSDSDVWAVGHFLNASNVFQTLTENWNGAAWNIVPSPSKAGTEASLNTVAAAPGNDVWAAGESGSKSLIERWTGTSWVVVPSPSRGGTLVNILDGLTIINGSDVWAVGQSQDATTGIPSTLIEQWNGLSWGITASPSPGSASGLTGIAADPTSGQAWAVGAFTGASGADQTLTEFNP